MSEPYRTIICLGDSITKGVRPGVEPDHIFEGVLEELLNRNGISTKVIASGIGGEQTSEAAQRFEQDVIGPHPDCVVIMYGTNDSHIYEGDSQPHLTVDEYTANLRDMICRAKDAGIQVALMTPVPMGSTGDWMQRSPYREHGPNCTIEPYVEAVRRTSSEENVLLVDNYAAWLAEAAKGHEAVDDLTTDGCHPNPAGHHLIARSIYSVLEPHLSRG